MYLLRRILDAHDGTLPPNAAAAFANTGKEREETLEFIAEAAQRWGVEIHWVEYLHRPDAAGGRKDPKHTFQVVDFETASRAGEPFAAMIKAASILPNVAMRKCTTTLKVQPLKQWALHHFPSNLQWTPNINVIGIRADEYRRISKVLMEECLTEYPLVAAGVTVQTVNDFWAAAPFDLRLHSARGNCDLCFLKGRANLLSTIKENPNLADWWIDQEEKVLLKNGRRVRNSRQARFVQRYSYRELRDFAVSQQTLPLPTPDDTAGIDCYCGD